MKKGSINNTKKIEYSKDNVLIIVRAYNEEKAIANVIQDLREHGCKHILVVDDCSKDKTYSIAKELGVYVVRHKINLGAGAALETGLKIAELMDFPAVIVFDGDGQHMAKDIDKFIEKLNQGYDVVIGSRFIELGEAINISITRKLVLKLGRIYTYIVSGIWLTDSHNGFRAFTKTIYPKLRFKFRDMTYASELIDIVAKSKVKLCEVPVTIRYFNRSDKQTSLNAIPIGIKMIIKKLIFW
ncbi:MAG: glycosyltransferase family 2 protein [Candidatus Woesearchaeota archaeon]